MADHEHPSQDGRRAIHKKLANQVGSKEERKLKARREEEWSIWFGLGMIGIIGWSVAIPTVAGALFGLWIDSVWPSRVSWTLTLLLLGLTLGCINAWRWVEQERQQIDQRQDNRADD